MSFGTPGAILPSADATACLIAITSVMFSTRICLSAGRPIERMPLMPDMVPRITRVSFEKTHCVFESLRCAH